MVKPVGTTDFDIVRPSHDYLNHAIEDKRRETTLPRVAELAEHGRA